MSRLAIIDIGYNAIRAVVYESDTLGAPEIFNDKFKSDILNLLKSDDLNIKHQTYLCFQYLIRIFKQLSVTEIKCVATAILRGHPKAEQFIKIIKDKYQIDINILSGEQEAYITAAGLISGITNANGIAADLGGGSLELVSVKNKKVGQLKSLPLGTTIIKENNLNNLDTIIQILGKQFGEIHYQNLYLIGGALRFIGRFYMDFVNYPLKTLHNLQISYKDFEIYLEKLECIYELESLKKQKNIEFCAIIVAKAMIKVFSPENIVISNYGLKEGVRFLALSTTEQEKDIIYEKIKALVKFNESACHFDKYRKIINPLLINPDSTTINLINFVIMLVQFNKNIDRTLRDNFSVKFILTSDIPFNHRERLMIALAMGFIYNSKSDLYISKLSKKILTKQDYFNSQIIGNCIRISREIDGPEFHEPSFSFDITGNYIEIKNSEILPRQIFQKACEHIKDIAYARKLVEEK